MKTLYMLKGLQASGKSTFAKKLVDEHPGSYKIVNKDQIRAMVDNGHWSGGNEKFVIKIRDMIVKLALTEGNHVIVDDTNLDPKHEIRLRELAKEFEAAFRVEDFTHVSVTDCIQRDRKRQSYVGEKVIRDTYERYLKPAPVVAPPNNPLKPNCVIVDLDGTLADLNGRNPYDASTCFQDGVRLLVKELVLHFYGAKNKVIFVSGRSEDHRSETEKWLRAEDKCGLGGMYKHLFMREAGDTRRDSIIKLEIYEKHIKGSYNVNAILDDRPSVIRECWQALGFTDRILNVGDGREF